MTGSRLDVPSGRLRVLLADDHRIVRESLTLCLGREPDVEIVGEADNGKQAVDMVARFHPDVVIMDLSMPVMNGIDATRIIKREWPGVRVIGLSMYERNDLAQDMLSAGADAYLTKSGPTDTLLAAIRGRDRE